MINWQRYKIDINFLIKNKENLLHFSATLNEAMIRTLYDNHSYDYPDWKMADHMVERFESFDSDPACFFSGTPHEQNLLSRGCQLIMDSTDAYVVTEFFKYIRYGLGIYGVETKCGRDYVERWQRLNSIEFFFILPEAAQVKIIEEYNDGYDRM